MELFVLFLRSVYKLGFPQGARVWQSNQLEKLLILSTEIIDHAFFPFVNSFTPWVIDMWLLHTISNCSQKLTRNTLYICVAGSQQFPQLFVGDVYGISELIEKIGVEVDTILKVTGKAFDPSLYCLPKITILWQVSFHNTSKRNRWKLWKFSIINWVDNVNKPP